MSGCCLDIVELSRYQISGVKTPAIRHGQAWGLKRRLTSFLQSHFPFTGLQALCEKVSI
jgi:hypothetical protein